MWALSWLGNVGGGSGILGFWTAVVLVAIRSPVVIDLAMRCALPATDTVAMTARMEEGTA